MCCPGGLGEGNVRAEVAPKCAPKWRRSRVKPAKGKPKSTTIFMPFLFDFGSILLPNLAPKTLPNQLKIGVQIASLFAYVF